MKLSISNIAWTAPQDEAVYEMMRENGFAGLEIAPTRIFPEAPYDRVAQAREWRGTLGFAVPSMQSIWFGRQENLFASVDERQALTDYTKKAIDFAAAIGCRNLVFGCPRNRTLPDGVDAAAAVPFFKELGDYALANDTVIGMEANPPIYNTNYINTTAEAIELIEQVGSDGFRLNLDVGTMVHNGESVDLLNGKVHLINHVHISEPKLAPIGKRDLHATLCERLAKEGYNGFVSIEMGKQDDLGVIRDVMQYVKGVFDRVL